MRRIHGVEDILLGFEPKDAGSIPAGCVFSNLGSKMLLLRFWRNRHEPVSSPPYHENLLHTIDSRLRASARHGWAGSCFEFCSPIRCRGVPSGAAAIIVSERELQQSPHQI